MQVLFSFNRAGKIHPDPPTELLHTLLDYTLAITCACTKAQRPRDGLIAKKTQYPFKGTALHQNHTPNFDFNSYRVFMASRGVM